MSTCFKQVLAVLGVLFGLASAAPALINPNFTPVHLVEQSETILQLTFTGMDDQGMVTAAVSKAIKGEYAHKIVRIDPAAAIAVGQREAFVNAVRAGQEHGLLFIGSFQPGGFGDGGGGMMEAGGEGGPKAIGYLHIDGLPTTQWLLLENWEDNLWDMVQGEAFLLATYNGGTDMLRRMVDYVLTDPEADVPVGSGVQWTEPIASGSVEGAVLAAEAVELTGDPAALKADLFLTRPEGDRLYRFEDGKLLDITERLKLQSRSRVHAWGDFNADDRLDLASFDGEALTLHLQQADGTFTPAAVDAGGAGGALAEGCLSLAAVDVGGEGAALIVGTRAMPMLLTFEGGSATSRPLVADAGDVPFPPASSGCVVADLDGDHVVDVLQLAAAGSLFYTGSSAGVFAAPVAAAVNVGEGGHDVALGDFDHDGLLDLFVASERQHMLWQNRGGGAFEEVMTISGELGYKHISSGNSAHAPDFNNDGRQDLVIGYSGPRLPYFLFNRGFRSFANALKLDLGEQPQLVQAGEGQQAMTFGDFNGDGALDLALVLADGQLWLLPRAVEGAGALAVRAALPPGEAEPLNVRASRFERSLGVRQVTAGEVGAFFGARSPGPILLTWQYPGAEEQQTEVIVESGPVRVVLER